jgi:hypothetical protein
MPEVRPGQRVYVTATKAVNHGAPATEVGFSGVAIKQLLPPGGTGLGDSKFVQVQVGEKFVIQTKGQVYVANSDSGGTTFAKGAAVYIIAASNLLTSAVGTNLKFGRVMEIAGERGVGTGQMRVDLEARDSF